MTVVMGIVNVTPDSFSDGGCWADAGAAVAHGLDLVSQGASIVDVGGESTRPGAQRVSEVEELRRVVPVVAALTARGITVSVDTMRSAVARASLEAGASIINDVSGGQADPEMFPVVANSHADLILMHWRAHSATMQNHATYHDVVQEVIAELLSQRDAAVEAGIASERIIIDPGIGFSKTAEHNWELLRAIPRFQALGHRLLIGVSRKAFLGAALDARPATGRDVATAALSCFCALHDVWAVRTHEVSMQRDAITVGVKLAH